MMCGTMGMYDDVVEMPIRRRVVSIDRCISHIVAALNAAGLETESSCCGHGKQDGSIILSDGRELVIRKWVPPLAIAEQSVKDCQFQMDEYVERVRLARERDDPAKEDLPASGRKAP